MNAAIIYEDVTAALKWRRRKKEAAGVKGITAEVILDAFDMILNLLIHAINQILGNGAHCMGALV